MGWVLYSSGFTKHDDLLYITCVFWYIFGLDQTHTTTMLMYVVQYNSQIVPNNCLKQENEKMLF